MQQKNSREDGDGKPYTQAAGVSLCTVREAKCVTRTRVHAYTRTQADAQTYGNKSGGAGSI